MMRTELVERVAAQTGLGIKTGKALHEQLNPELAHTPKPVRV